MSASQLTQAAGNAYLNRRSRWKSNEEQRNVASPWQAKGKQLIKICAQRFCDSFRSRNIGRWIKSKSPMRLVTAQARRNEVRRALRDLEQAGEIARIRKNRYVLPDAADLVTGTLSVHQAGYAFLTNEKPGQSDLFIAAENTGTAMHGDRVVARIIRGAEFSRARKPRAEGRVIRILTRANETIVGTLQQTRNFFYVVPDDPRLVHNIYVQPSSMNGRQPRVGDKVVVRLEAWESRHVNPEGKIIELLGPRTAPGVDILSIIRKYHLPVEFPRAVLEEASAIPETVTADAIDGREDLRSQFIVTIDPDDARDFDDAIHVEEIKGGWQLGVHIADVARIRAARQRARSRGATPRQQRLLAGPCNSDVARAVEQRRLQLESPRRSADAFRLPAI